MTPLRVAVPFRGLASRQSFPLLITSNPWASRASFVTSQILPLRVFSRRISSANPLLKQKEYFPPPKTQNIIETEDIWQHPKYSDQRMKAVRISHLDARDFSDWWAWQLVRLLRWTMDTATGYKARLESEDGDFKGAMTERKWLIRFIFLESIAGVPGMVAGMIRHLNSLRRLKRDNGWIQTLLEEAYNERMHLLTFLKLGQPGILMRLTVLGAQGVFFNAFFLSYLVAPRTCHRFVGYLEEEAVKTYTHAIDEIKAGHLPLWKDLEAPEIAVKYWGMPEGHRKMMDLLLYIRADEAKHREVNHTLGNLNQKSDPNPYTAKYRDPTKPHPTSMPEPTRPVGWQRKEVI